MPRNSIAGLMALVLYLAIACAALRSNSVWWGAGLILIAVVAIATASLVAIARRGPSRLRWAGFAIFGWAYLLLGLPQDLEDLRARPLALAAVPMELLYPHLNPDAPPTRPISPRLPYLWASHAILTIAFGVLGAGIGCLVRCENDPTRPTDGGLGERAV